MSEEQPDRYIVTNHQTQPIELHLTTGVIVLGSSASAEMRESDLASPQFQVLRQNRLITARPVVEAPSSPAPEIETPSKPARQTGRRDKTKSET